jgi:hypothetical protein
MAVFLGDVPEASHRSLTLAGSVPR